MYRPIFHRQSCCYIGTSIIPSPTGQFCLTAIRRWLECNYPPQNGHTPFYHKWLCYRCVNIYNVYVMYTKCTICTYTLLQHYKLLIHYLDVHKCVRAQMQSACLTEAGEVQAHLFSRLYTDTMSTTGAGRQLLGSCFDSS